MNESMQRTRLPTRPRIIVKTSSSQLLKSRLDRQQTIQPRRMSPPDLDNSRAANGGRSRRRRCPDRACPSPSEGAPIIGTVCWGHSTGVIESNIRTFVDNWAGTGTILNGDLEMAEWGYLSFEELKAIKIPPGFEIDCDQYWQIKKAIDIEKIRMGNHWPQTEEPKKSSSRKEKADDARTGYCNRRNH